MFKAQTISDLIKEKINLRPLSSGWYACKCQVCNDYKERAGFKFIDEGQLQAIVTNCWNCGLTSRYDEFSGKISKKFRSLLTSYGIDDSEINNIVNSSFFTQSNTDKKTITLDSITKINTKTPTIKLPEKCFKLGSTDQFLTHQEKLCNYLISRKIDPLKYAFYFSLEERFVNRIIIPFYRDGNLIYWQARSILKNEKKRYDNAPVSRDAVIFNVDKLYSYSQLPLFVTEGVFDALPFDTIAILGSKLNKAKAEIISKSNRRLIFVIDKDENGKHLAEDVIKRGWEITFSPEGSADINNAIQRFGYSWTALKLMENIPKSGSEAQLAINMNCR